MEALPNSRTGDIFLRIWTDVKHADLEAVRVQCHQREDGLSLRRVSDAKR